MAERSEGPADLMKIRCRLKVRVDQAGYDSRDALMRRVDAYPHLRPCPRTLNKYDVCSWQRRVDCLKCSDVVVEAAE
jgi:hypothetical protein